MTVDLEVIYSIPTWKRTVECSYSGKKVLKIQ